MKRVGIFLLILLTLHGVLTVYRTKTLAALNVPKNSFTEPHAFFGTCADLPICIKKLGMESDPSKTIEQLHPCGHKAVPLLVHELRIVNPEIVNAQWWHVVWVERALRSITGQYFRFTSNEKFGKIRELRRPSEKMGFVTEWMSRGQVYIAPRDVQTNVIHAWRKWLKVNGNFFQVKKFEPYGEWFF